MLPEIIINGRFLCQRTTGVQRVSREFTLAADKLLEEGNFPNLKIRLIAPMGADFTPLKLKKIKTEHLPGGQGYRWEQIFLARRVGKQPLISLGNTAPLSSLFRNPNVGVMLHDQSYRLYPKDYSLMYRVAHAAIEYLILRKASPLFTVSQTEASFIGASHSAVTRDIVVAANGSWIEDEIVKIRPIGAGKNSFGLYVGGFSKRKNFEGAFAAATALAEAGSDFIFVGQPNAESEALFLSISPEIRRRIKFIGYVDNDELINLYRSAAFLLYPSFYEASGLPPSEAMIFGCPVIVSDLPVMHERCGDAALYCDPHDTSSIIAQVKRIIGDPELAALLSERGHSHAQRFTWRSQAITILQAVIENFPK